MRPKITINLMGPGCVGLALAQALIASNQYDLLGLYHPNLNRAENAVRHLHQGKAYAHINQLPQADITFITTQDVKIKTIVDALLTAKNLKPKSLVVHCSGILSANILAPLKTEAVYIGSFHPLKAFYQQDTPEDTPEKNAFFEIDCAIEGEAEALLQLRLIGKHLNAHLFEINPAQKATYHAAAVIASNYLVTLSAEASKLFIESGIPQEKAHALCTRLMQTSLSNLKQVKTAKAALTGPLIRGDIDTIEKHLQGIQSIKLKKLYKVLGESTLSLTELPPKTHDFLKTLLRH